MNYFVMRDGKQHGPYSLADLQRSLEQGTIRPDDICRDEAATGWTPVEKIAGIRYEPRPAPTPAEPKPAPKAWEVPPGLHWGVVLALSVVTVGIFAIIWLFVEAAFVRRLTGTAKPLVLYAIGFCLTIGAAFVQTATGADPLAEIVRLIGSGVIITGHFLIKNALEEHYTTDEPIGLSLSGVMTFFFNVIYFQYHLNDIRKWRLTGSFPGGSSGPSLSARRGIIYTSSELESMGTPPRDPQ